MKIDKIQCDICGKNVNYNDERIGNMLSNRSFMGDQPCIDRGFYDRFKVNQLTILGITSGKNDAIINMKFDLCEECLIDLHKMINKWKNQRSEENEFSS